MGGANHEDSTLKKVQSSPNCKLFLIPRPDKHRNKIFFFNVLNVDADRRKHFAKLHAILGKRNHGRRNRRKSHEHDIAHIGKADSYHHSQRGGWWQEPRFSSLRFNWKSQTEESDKKDREKAEKVKKEESFQFTESICKNHNSWNMYTHEYRDVHILF